MALSPKLLDGMVVFVEVVNSGSFTVAAQNTGHSSSYISKEINKLEERLGVRLLNRTTRSLSLTAEGERYYQQAQQIAFDAEQLESEISGSQAEPKGLLRVSCPVSFGLSRLSPVIGKFIEMYPRLDLELELNDRKIDMVAEGFDVLIRGAAHLEDSTLVTRRFIQSYGLTIASPEYLKKAGTPKHPKELPEHKTLTYTNLKRPDIWKYLDEQGQEFWVKVNNNVTTNSPELELALCLSGQGIVRLPGFNLQDQIERGQLVELFPSLPKTNIDLYLVYASRKHISLKVRSFIGFILGEFEQGAAS